MASEKAETRREVKVPRAAAEERRGATVSGFVETRLSRVLPRGTPASDARLPFRIS